MYHTVPFGQISLAVHYIDMDMKVQKCVLSDNDTLAELGV